MSEVVKDIWTWMRYSPTGKAYALTVEVKDDQVTISSETFQDLMIEAGWWQSDRITEVKGIPVINHRDPDGA